MDWSAQLRHCTNMSVQGGTSKRFNCPKCGGQKTLSISKAPGSIRWHCFRASCDMTGGSNRERTRLELLSALKPPAEDAPKPMPRPEGWTSPLSSEAAVDWMQRSHVMWAFANGHANLAFDPQLNRLVFLIRNEHFELMDAAGRALGPGAKWHRYAKSGLPFVVCPGHDTAVVVEDAASACAVAAAGYTGIAMLGTDLLASHLPAVRSHSRVVVALDPDAAGKAMKIANRLSPWTLARPALLPDDPKYYAAERLRELINEPSGSA